MARAGEAESSRPVGGTSRFRVLRMAATVVVSLGAGWLARDLTGPARDIATTQEVDAEAPPAARAALSEVSPAPVDAPTAARIESADEVMAGRRDLVGTAPAPRPCP